MNIINKINKTISKGTVLSSSLFIAMSALFVSCENGDEDFPDYQGGTMVYFPYQYPVRTIVLGREYAYDNKRDNAHEAIIYATFGGAYDAKNIKVNVEVDNSLCNNLFFEDGITPVTPMPADYYTLSTNVLDYSKGPAMMGGTTVHLTDAFFNDPKSLTTTYVIPLVMKSQTGASGILVGKSMLEDATPSRFETSAWAVLPKDYVLYCFKFICKYEAYWLRAGKDVITVPGSAPVTKERTYAEVIDREKVNTVTKTISSAIYKVVYNIPNSGSRSVDLLLTFDNEDKCTVTSLTSGVTVSGNGAYTADTAKKAWGNLDRDELNLNFTVTFNDGVTVQTEDNLIYQRRGWQGNQDENPSVVQFKPVYKN